MSVRVNIALVLSIWLVVLAISKFAKAERWSRQVTNSEWIPLANPRNQQGQNQNLVPQLLPQIHQPLIPSSLPPELRQEYQQQLLQLQKTQESIQRLLMLQQQLKAQQQLLQGQGFLASGVPESDENKQALHQGALSSAQSLPELGPDDFVPHQLSNQPKPPVYTSQNFHEQQGEAIGQEQYEDYTDRQVQNYRNAERGREELREKERYVPETSSGPITERENNNDGEEEIQVVYVPAETLAQHGQAKSQQRGRDRKQFGNQDTRHHQQHPYTQQQNSFDSGVRHRDNDQTTVPPEDDAYAREFLQQLQREHEGTDRLLKEAREKELARLREERKEIQRRAKLQQAALQREQELQRQRDAEKKQKELEKLEEAAKQRELQRIRESRERQRLEELERSKKAQARINEEKRKQEEARQAEIDRLAALERQKKAEIERTIAAQKDLERLQKEEEERARESERGHLVRQKEASKIHHDDVEGSPQAQPLIKNQHSQQHLGQSGKYHRHGRIRNKQRPRPHNQNIEHTERTVQETTTTMPPSPNQPPLAVYMSKLVSDVRVLRVTDVLKTLKGAQSIDVLDTVGQNAPQVFVGPSNLEVPAHYAKFDLPYLSSIDNNRVERRVDKLPFFVAPLSFNPPPGYSKIPFPAPHIGSVVINNLDSNIPITQPDASPDEVVQANLNPLIEPNSFSDESNQGLSYSTTYDSSTNPTHTNVRHEEPSATPQYQTSSSYSHVEASGPESKYRFRQSFNVDTPSAPVSQGNSKFSYQEQSQLRPNYQEESSLPLSHDVVAQYNEEPTRPTTPIYRRPNVVTSFAYQEAPQPVPSSTPIYEQSYSNVRDEMSPNNHDPSQNREIVNRYQFADEDKNEREQEYLRENVNAGAVQYENGPVGPTQYNLPAELPPIHPQLPGLVNSLLEEGEQAAFVERYPSVPTTTVTTTTKIPATTEIPPTTQRSRGRHRGRIVPTRPTTTTTTSISPSGKSRDTDRTRRPFGRTRSRFTTTTEEYTEAYEPTKNKATATTPRYNAQENSRRPNSSKAQKYRHRETDSNIHGSRHQLNNVQAHEATNSRNPSLDTNSRQPETGEVDSNQSVYAQYDYASATTSRENYPIPVGDGVQVQSAADEMELTKTLNSPQTKASPLTSLRNQEDSLAHQFPEHYPNSDFGQTVLEDTPVNGFNYQLRNEQSTTSTAALPITKEYPYYQEKQETFDSAPIPIAPTNTPYRSQINNYQRPQHYENSKLARPQSHFPINDDKTSGFDAGRDSVYDPYSRDNEDELRAAALIPEQSPLELTTEAPTTTTSTTEAAPVTLRQRVRARLGGRSRPDSAIQTKPRGSQDEYVRFSAVNTHNIQTTERPASRHRESHRAKPKARQQHQGVQVQTEGDEYVRIQAPIRTYQKTIVTPPSTTQRTTTTQAPTTTTVEYEPPNDELEYGFIRPPNFVPIHPVDNRYQNSYRIAENQAQLQSILPTDETTADTNPSHAQVSRNRPKYQSPNRRPANKIVPSTTLASDTSPYTERPRSRVEEPKNNRIRVRGRKPGRRRTTTTTTTTTEYVLDENNDLPLGENYPRPAQHLDGLAHNGPEFFDEKFEALPLTSEGLTNPNHQQHRENSFSSQDFLLNFGPESDQLTNTELDQTQLASQPSRKYGHPGAARSRTNHQANQDRDIYGSESQWSTKLTSTSFQPSPSVNRLVNDDRKRGKNKYSKEGTPDEAPEVITAPPEESYVTIMVSSDALAEKNATPSDDSSLEVSSVTDMNYGMKTSIEGQKTSAEITTPTPFRRSTLGSNATTTTMNNEGEKYGDFERVNQPTRRVSGRRRRVRVRVRPAVSDDFVTAESQHFNSAINNLVHDRIKYRSRLEEPRETATTLDTLIVDKYVSTEAPIESFFEDLLKEVFKTDNKSSNINEVSKVSNPKKSAEVSTGSEYTEVFTGQPKVDTDERPEVKNQSEVTSSQPLELTNSPQTITEQTEMFTEQSAITTDQSESTTDRSEIVTNQFEAITTTANQFETVKESKNSTNLVPSAEESMHLEEENSNAVHHSTTNESPTNTPLITTMTIPRKSWDSTRSFKDSSALNKENGIFEDNGIIGRDNEVVENDYRGASAKNGISSLNENNGESNYPKNHRAEWSEVRYPTNPEFYNYNRQYNVTSTQLPGTEAKSDGDASVKTLSDYVKAIFDTMKDADEQKSEKDTFSIVDSMSRDEERVSATSSDSFGTSENSENDFTTVSSSVDYSTEKRMKSEESSIKSVSSINEPDGEDKNEAETQEPLNTEASIWDEKERLTEEPRNKGIEETTKYVEATIKYVEPTTEMSTEGNSIDSSDSATNTKFSKIPTTAKSFETDESKIEQSTSSTTESLPTTKGFTQMNLGAILRTSTTTKVSHMTEICYRGRCVMTKPKKEINAR